MNDTLTKSRITQAKLGENRLRVLETAVRRVFSESNFHEADMRTIARQAGMGFNTIYKYFGDKEGLLFYFVRRWQDELADRVAEQTDGLTEPSEKLRKVFWSFLDFYGRNPDVGRILYLTLPMTTWMHNETFSQRDLTETILGLVREAQAAGQLRRDIPASLALDILHGMIHRAFTMSVYRGGTGDLRASTASLFDLFWNGVCVDGSQVRNSQ